VRTLIADDEQICRETLRRLLRHDPAVEIVAIATGGDEALEAANRLRPDLLFLDVDMPGTNGFSVVRGLRMPFLPAIVFITGNERGAIEAFEVAATDYLLKPCRLDRLKVALQRVRSQMARQRFETLSARATLPIPAPKSPPLTSLAVREDGHEVWLDLDEICWIESHAGHLTIRAGARSYKFSETLEQLHAKLPARGFFLASPGLLLNLDQVRELRVDADTGPVAIFQDGARQSIPPQSLHLLPLLVNAVVPEFEP